MMQLVQYIRVDQCVPYTIPSSNGSPATYVERGNIIYFTASESVEIKRSTDEMVQTCRVVLPKRFIASYFAQFDGPRTGTQSSSRGTSDYRGINVNQSEDFVPIIGNIATVNPSKNNQTINYAQPVSNNFASNIDNLSLTGTASAALNGTGPYLGPDTLYDPPVFMRGDMITVWLGYAVDNNQTGNTPSSNQRPAVKLYQQFTGYVASVNASDNVVLECEDLMWYFKQLRIPNGQFCTSPNLVNGTGGSTKMSAKYPCASNDILYSQVDGPNRSSAIKQLLNTPDSYPANTINGLIFNSLNNALNYVQLATSGIWPLVYDLQAQKPQNPKQVGASDVPMPYVCIAGNPEYNLGSINVDSNASFFSLLELLKTQFNQNVYVLPVSSYDWTIDPTYGLPYDSVGGTYDPWASNYINLGFSRYVDQDIYQYQTYSISLNGPSSTCISQNLTYKRTEDFLVGAYVKTFQDCDWVTDDDTAGVVKPLTNAQTGNSLKRTYYKALHVGDYGGQSFTYFFSCRKPFVKTRVPIVVNGAKTWPMVPQGSENGVPYAPDSDASNMFEYGVQQLSKVHYSGYYGSFTTIGYPFINFGDRIAITDTLYPERNGTYLVKEVVVRLDRENALTQEVFLDYLVLP